MKINKTNNGSEVDLNFEGLAVDCDGALWIFGAGGAAYVDASGSIGIHKGDDWKVVFKQYSPFTKYNGQLVLEND